MKDPTQSIIDSLDAVLTGNVEYNDRKVQVFTRPPKAEEIPIVKGALYHYIEIGDISDTETPNDADTYTHDVTVDVQVVVGFPGYGDKTILNNIVNQVSLLILTGKGSKLDLGADFSNILIYKEISFDTLQEGMHKTIIKTMRYRLEIDEN